MSEQELAVIEENAIMASSQAEIEAALAGMDLPALPDQSVMDEDGVFNNRPYITLVQGQSKHSGPPYEFRAGTFALTFNKANVIDIGRSFDCYIAHWRNTAMITDRKLGIFESYHDRDSEKFMEIATLAKSKVDGYTWGYELLLYLSKEGVYASLYCNNPTLQRACREQLTGFIHKTCTIEAEYIVKEKMNQKWWGLKATACSTPLIVPLDIAQLKIEAKTFSEEADVLSVTPKQLEDHTAPETSDARPR